MLKPRKSADFLSESLYKPRQTAYISRPVTRRGGLREPGYAATQRFWAAGGFVGFGAGFWHRRPTGWIVARSLARALRREGFGL